MSDDFRKTLHFTNNPSELQTSRRANLSALDEDPLIIPDVATLNLLFDKMNDPSIPFAYAVDGCYARAHWMRKILNDNGYECEKLFAYGDNSTGGIHLLSVNTPSGCCVEWFYHVAPVVKYINATNQVVDAVIDPSLFTQPVSILTWYNQLLTGTCRTHGFPKATTLDIVRLPGDIYTYEIDPPYTGIYLRDATYAKTMCINMIYGPLSGCIPASVNVSSCFPPYLPDF